MRHMFHHQICRELVLMTKKFYELINKLTAINFLALKNIQFSVAVVKN